MENITAGEALVIEFSAKALAPVALFKADKDVRFYLNGICVQPGPDGVGCYVVGCDGHRLAVWYDADGKCSRKTVLRVSREIVQASRKKGAKDSRVVLDGGRLVIVGCQEYFVQAGKAEIDMDSGPRGVSYPEVFKVVPKESALKPGAHGSVNGCYFEDIGKVAKLLNGGSRFGFGVWHFTAEPNPGGWGAIVTRFEGQKDFLVVTMPMRSDGLDSWSKLPEAVTRKHQEVEAAEKSLAAEGVQNAS